MESCAFSGHRAIPASSGPALRDLLMRAINYAYEQGCRTFYCGGAIGFVFLVDLRRFGIYQGELVLGHGAFCATEGAGLDIARAMPLALTVSTFHFGYPTINGIL